MSRIFITGGSGFVGAHLVRRMVADGHDVTVFAPGPEPCLGERDLADIMLIEGGVEEPGALDSSIAIARPEVVVGLAAFGGSGRGLLAAANEDEAKALAVNVGGFGNLLAACKRHGVQRLLWASTLGVYGDPSLYGDDPVDESAPPRPESFYGLTKLLAENIARFYHHRRGLAVTGLRLPVIFGPGLWYRGAASQIAELFQAAASGGAATLEVSRRPLELMYVKDVAEVFSRLVAHRGALDPIYNLRAYAPSLHEMVTVLKSLSPGLAVTTTDVEPALAFPLVSAARLAAATGIAATWSLEAACADTLADLRTESP